MSIPPLDLIAAVMRCLDNDHDESDMEDIAKSQGGLGAVWESGYQAALHDLEQLLASIRNEDNR